MQSFSPFKFFLFVSLSGLFLGVFLIARIGKTAASAEVDASVSLGATSQLQSDTNPLNPKSSNEAELAISPALTSELASAWGKFQMGDYEGAIALLRAQLRSFPADSLVRKNLGTALFALALVNIQSQNWAEAEKLLEESEKQGNLEAKRTLASLKLKLGNADLATNLFELLADDTQDSESLKMLVDLSVRADNLDRAADFLAKLPPEDPFTISKRSQIELRRRFQKSGQFWERGGIEVAADAKVDPAAGEAALNSLDVTLSKLAGDFFGPLPPHVRMKAFLYPARDFYETTGSPPWAGGLFDGLISLPVREGVMSATALKAMARTLQHEATHAYFYGFCGDTLPSWIGEGLATAYEGRTQKDSFYELKKNFGPLLSKVPTIFLDKNFADVKPQEVGRLYAQSQLMVFGFLNETSSLSSESLGLWKGILSRSCLGRESLGEVLSAEFGTAIPETIWANRLAQMKN